MGLLIVVTTFVFHWRATVDYLLVSVVPTKRKEKKRRQVAHIKGVNLLRGLLYDIY